MKRTTGTALVSLLKKALIKGGSLPLAPALPQKRCGVLPAAKLLKDLTRSGKSSAAPSAGGCRPPQRPPLYSLFMLILTLTFTAPGLWAQVQDEKNIITPTPMTQGSGGLTPYFWIGLQTVFSAGYNMETKAGGFRDYGGDNYTYASFNIAFVDSHYSTPKIFEVSSDPDTWSGKFKMMNFTGRINSYTTREINNPAWLAEISGKGARIGFFSQAGMVIGSLEDTQNNTGTSTSANDPKPWTKISAGNKVLALGDDDLGKNYYNGYRSTPLPHETVYTANSTGKSAVMYAGYEKRNVWNAYLTMLSEGNVNSNLTKNSQGDTPNDGFAAALDFGVSPFGPVTGDEHPMTFNLTGNFAGGANFETNENIGFGLKAETGHWLFDNYVVAPVFAFDGKLDVNNEFTWKTGGGLTFQFSGMRWVADDWNEITTITNYDFRYENNQILKYAYAQAYLAYSEQTDFDMVLKAEEPDGDAGFHEKLGAMYELRLYNLAGKVTTNTIDWSMWGRVSWDFNIKSYLISPYVRAYFDSAEVFKLRLGAQANVIPYTGFEIAYTAANLNPNADTAAKPMSHYDGVKDAGRLELIVILKSDNARPRTPKRMDFWNYSAYANGMP